MVLDHVGIAVRDAESALALMQSLLGESPYKSETVEEDGVRTHFIRSGTAKLELLEALADDSPVARHIEKRGPGLHHLAFEVEDLDDTRRRLTERGFTVLGEPRPGADGKRIFFVHPRDTEGVLFEFCRQNRSILEQVSLDVGERQIGIRRAGKKGPPVLIVPPDSVDVDRLVRRLEQSTRMIVVDDHAPDVNALLDALEYREVHLILPASRLSQDAYPVERIRSLVVVVDESVDVALPDVPGLAVATSSLAAEAAAVYARWPDSEVAVGDDDVISLSIEKHILQFEGA